MFKARPATSARWLLLLSLLVLLFVAACDDDDDPIVDNPDVEIPTVTVTVEGSFGQASASDHEFTGIVNGFARMTLTELSPVNTLTIGIGIGQFADDGSCVILASDRSVRVTDSLLSEGVVAGQVYCVTVFDVGNLFEGNVANYTMTIEHS